MADLSILVIRVRRVSQFVCRVDSPRAHNSIDECYHEWGDVEIFSAEKRQICGHCGSRRVNESIVERVIKMGRREGKLWKNRNEIKIN